MALTSLLLLAVSSVLVCCMHKAEGNLFISGDNHIELFEMNKQCCHSDMKWLSCCGITRMLMNPNNTVKLCMNKNATIDPSLLPKVRFIDKLDKKTETCPKKKEKTEARVHYCHILYTIDKSFVEDLIPRLTATKDCLSMKNSTAFRTPGHLLETIKKWHSDMRNHHNTTKCCFRPFTSTYTDTELLEKYTITLDTSSAMTMSEAKEEQSKKCTNRWDVALGKVINNMEVVRILESLGRRDTCLRGCVSTKTAKCVDHLLT